MTNEQFSSLPSSHTKVVLYLIYVSTGVWKFDLKKHRKLCNLSEKEIFKVWQYLFDLDIISFRSENEYGQINLGIEHIKINLLVHEWSINTINSFNDIVFNNNPSIMIELVNQIYRNIGKYDDKTMGQFLNANIDIRPVDLPDDFKKKIDDKARRQAERRKFAERAKTLVEVFYGLLFQRISMTLTDRLREEEIEVAKSFLQQYSEFPIEFLTQAIKWFFLHEFWGSVIVNLSLFQKHFPKYLAAEKGIKKTRTHKIKMI